VNPIYSGGTNHGTLSAETDGGDGPYRVGIFATDTSSRISSGATYYGIMDFSKNINQYFVSLGSQTSRTLSYKKNGDGYLNVYGNSDQNEFFNQSSNGMMAGGSMYIFKQGTVSSRQNNYPNLASFRSVRSAPSDN